MADNKSINTIMEIIDDIEEYIDSCKFKAFSNDQIIVNKEELEMLLNDLKKAAPVEIKKSQAIMSNKEQILEDAKLKAKELIAKTKEETNELISQHEIMLQAYEQADGVVNDAIARGQEIIDNATLEANEYRTSAMAYTDSLLAQVEDVVGHYIGLTNNKYDEMMGSLQECYELVRANRAELLHTSVDDTGLDVENFINESTEAAEALRSGQGDVRQVTPAEPTPTSIDALSGTPIRTEPTSASDAKDSDDTKDGFINLDLI